MVCTHERFYSTVAAIHSLKESVVVSKKSRKDLTHQINIFQCQFCSEKLEELFAGPYWRCGTMHLAVSSL